MFAGEDPLAASGVWHKRPRSRPHLRRPPQLGSDSLGSADASLQTRRPSHARRAVWAAWVLRELLSSDSHARAIAELGSNFDARIGRGSRSGAPVWLCVSQTNGPFYNGNLPELI